MTIRDHARNDNDLGLRRHPAKRAKCALRQSRGGTIRGTYQRRRVTMSRARDKRRAAELLSDLIARSLGTPPNPSTFSIGLRR